MHVTCDGRSDRICSNRAIVSIILGSKGSLQRGTDESERERETDGQRGHTGASSFPSHVLYVVLRCVCVQLQMPAVDAHRRFWNIVRLDKRQVKRPDPVVLRDWQRKQRRIKLLPTCLLLVKRATVTATAMPSCQ